MKKLGQHFLVDVQTVNKIIEAAGITGADTVFEIGPGRGALTEAIAKKAAELIAVEMDPHLAHSLKEKLGQAVVNADFLKYDLDSIPQSLRPVKFVGNIPYAITGPVIQKILSWNGWSIAVIMVQKEVAHRITAGAGQDRERGLLTLSVEIKAEAKFLFEVPRRLFKPVPGVDSAVIKLKKLAQPRLTVDEGMFFKVVRAAFSQRRKQLPRALANTLGIEKETVVNALKTLGLDPRIRPENLAWKEFEQITELIQPYLNSR